MPAGNLLKTFSMGVSIAVAATLLSQHSVLAQNRSLAGPSVDQLVEDIQERTEFDAFGWPARGHFTPHPEALDQYVQFNRRIWEKYRFSWQFNPTLMAQFGTQGGPSDFTASYQHNATIFWQPFVDTHIGTTSFVASAIQVRQLTATTGVDFSQSLGINYFVSDSVADSNALKALYWRQDLPGDVVNFRLGHVELSGLVLSCSYACDDTTSFLSSPLSANPAGTMAGQGMGLIVGINLGPNVTFEAAVGDGNGDGNLNLGRPFHTGELTYVASLEAENLFPTYGAGKLRLAGYYVEPTKQGTPGAQASTSGLGIHFEQDVGDVGLFARYLTAFGRQGSVSHTGAAGAVWKKPFGHDEDWLGFGVGFVEPTAAGSRTEYVSELFYRMQLTPLTQLTAGGMLVAHPSDQTKNDIEGVFSLRLRAAL